MITRKRQNQLKSKERKRLSRQRETRAELRYRYHERLAILADGAEPTAEQKAIAEQDAQQWHDERANQS